MRHKWQTRIAVDKKAEQTPSGGRNNQLQNRAFAMRPSGGRPNVRTTEYTKMIQIFLTEALASDQDKTGMPDNLKAGLEKLSGTNLSDVSVHQNSDKPQQIDALVYTQGNDIHIASGQEKHLPHEGWHVVQQKQGRVEPTLQMKTGVLVNDDAGLEKEADIMGSRSAQEGSQSSNQDSSNGNVQSSRKTGAQSSTVQLQKAYQIQLRNHEGNVIQRVTTMKEKASVGEITQAEYGQKNDNVKNTRSFDKNELLDRS